MKYRLAIVLPIYLTLFTCCYFGAYLLRFDFNLPEQMMVLFLGKPPAGAFHKNAHLLSQW